MNNDYDICFLSILFDYGNKYYEDRTLRHRSQNITSIQRDIIEGLKECNATFPWVINTLLVPLYPQGYKYPVIKGKNMTSFNGVNHSFVNVPFIYSTSLFYGAKKAIKKWAMQNRTKPKAVFAYSLTTYTLKAISYVKKINPDIKTVIVVPDLPQFTYRETNNILVKIKNRLSQNKVLNQLERYSYQVDGWLLFSKHMKEKIPHVNRFLTFEGIATDIFSEIKPKRLVPDNTYEVLYAGGLNKSYGVQMLLDAFSSIESDKYCLVLAGHGDLEDEIKKRMVTDSRIKFLGEISRQNLLELEKAADLLVNPRVDCAEYTRYSFPSKNMEYLSSGTPMLGYKLDGIPDDYDQYINYFDEPNSESLMKAIRTLCEQDTRKTEKSKRAKEFVLEDKNKYTWGDCFFQFLKNL